MKSNASRVAKKVHGLFLQRQLFSSYRKTPGQKPGTAIFTGSKKLDKVILTLHDYDSEHFESLKVNHIEECRPWLDKKSNTWIHVQGLHNVEALRSIWEYFDLHPLVREDIVHTSQRAKIEHYPNYIFIVLKVIKRKSSGTGSESLTHEQISIVLGKDWVLTFQESDDPIFSPLLQRIEVPSNRFRRYGGDYLAYAIMDMVVDHYFESLDLIGETLEEIEDHVLTNPQEEQIQQIHNLRRDLIHFRKSVRPLRDSVNSLMREESDLMSEDVKVFLRDVVDHIIQVVESIETGREMIFGLYDMYNTALSNRMNEVMKVLTIIATIFIPLTFVAGIYGMNFNPDVSPYNMPELNWYYGYPVAMGVMLFLALLMTLYFRRKKWL